MFKKEIETYLECSLSKSVVGFIEDDSNTIVYLNYKNWNKTTHNNCSVEEYYKVIVHELVHIIHSNYCKKNYPGEFCWEGIAYYLANQKNNKYYDFMLKLINELSHEQILKILLND